MVQAKRILSFILAVLLTAVLQSYTLAYYDSPPDNEDEIREKLSGIISSSEDKTSDQEKGFIEETFDSIVEMVDDKYREVFKKKWEENSIMDEEVSPEVFDFLSYLSIALTVFIIFIIVFIIFRNAYISKKIKKDDEEILLSVKEPEDMLKVVDKHIRKGDYNNALRFLYIASLIKLNNYNIVKLNKSKTNKQYLTEIKLNRPDLFNIFSKFTQDFNKYCYGGRVIRADKFQNWYQAYFEIITKERRDKNS